MNQIFIEIFLLSQLVFIRSVEFNKLCTFSQGTCQWNIGRRWHIVNQHVDNQILVADSESFDDQRIGFTDTIMSSWLKSSSICSDEIRISFQSSIENRNDFIEIYLIWPNRTRSLLLKQSNNSIEPEVNWQQVNLTLKSTETFRIDIDVRHLPDYRTRPIVWFAIDNLMLENCPNGIRSTTMSSTSKTTTNDFEFESIPLNFSKFKLENLTRENPSTSTPRQTLFTLIVYLLCALIAMTLLLILLIIIIYNYRNSCFPCLGRDNFAQNRIGIHVENFEDEHRIRKAIETTVRPCF